ncbi:MAG: GGDEF domain-containing protein [Campylobacterales bacterium]|nr:GGDEF domain-containing protein [Campylobacterales bacterium]
MELLFAFASSLLLLNTYRSTVSYPFSSRIFIFFMALPIYWSLLCSESPLESTILFVFLPLISIILRPFKEVIVLALLFGGSFIGIVLFYQGTVELSGIELYKLIMVQILVSVFIFIYVHNNRNYQEIISMQSQKLKAANLQLEKLYQEKSLEASTDSLTGLNNRGAFMPQFEQLHARFDRQRERFCLILFDLDHFKEVNDAYGHSEGDLVLQHVAKESLKAVRKVDMLARYGGEEFAVLLPNTPLQMALSVAERIRNAIEQNVKTTGRPITASFGVVEIKEGMSVSQMTDLADQALYRAKADGRNRVESAE